LESRQQRELVTESYLLRSTPHSGSGPQAPHGHGELELPTTVQDLHCNFARRSLTLAEPVLESQQPVTAYISRYESRNIPLSKSAPFE
jgi:hypothetical protein